MLIKFQCHVESLFKAYLKLISVLKSKHEDLFTHRQHPIQKKNAKKLKKVIFSLLLSFWWAFLWQLSVKWCFEYSAWQRGIRLCHYQSARPLERGHHSLSLYRTFTWPNMLNPTCFPPAKFLHLSRLIHWPCCAWETAFSLPAAYSCLSFSLPLSATGALLHVLKAVMCFDQTHQVHLPYSVLPVPAKLPPSCSTSSLLRLLVLHSAVLPS